MPQVQGIGAQVSDKTIEERALDLLRGRADRQFAAYYYSFDPTGVEEIDMILAAIAWAGKAYHHTEWWNDEDVFDDVVNVTHIDVIQMMATRAARRLTA